ncbi:MAG: hypothetical protein MHMPM18_004194, partial [Marteilia pararefringens]
MDSDTAKIESNKQSGKRGKCERHRAGARQKRKRSALEKLKFLGGHFEGFKWHCDHSRRRLLSGEEKRKLRTRITRLYDEWKIKRQEEERSKRPIKESKFENMQRACHSIIADNADEVSSKINELNELARFSNELRQEMERKFTQNCTREMQLCLATERSEISELEKQKRDISREVRSNRKLFECFDELKEKFQTQIDDILRQNDGNNKEIA